MSKSRYKPIFTLSGLARAPMFAGAEWVCRKGEQWVVKGPNGSGKSYLAAILAQTLPARGLILDFAPEVEGRVALVSFAQQQRQGARGWLQARWHSLDENEDDVESFLSFEAVNEINPYEVRGDDSVERRDFEAREKNIGPLFDVDELRTRRMKQLSNGEMRRVLLSRALLKDPALLVLDDPFAGLDGDMRLRLGVVLERLARKGLSMVLTVRQEEEIPSYATHCLELDNCGIAGRRRIERENEDTRGRLGFSRERIAPVSELGVGTRSASGARAAESVVELRDVTIRYGRRVLFEDFGWVVRKGELWLLVGPNGSGKTTLLSLICGDNPAAYANYVSVFGQRRRAGADLWSIRRRIGQVSPEIQCHANRSLSALATVLAGRVDADGGALPVTEEGRADAMRRLADFGVGNEWSVPLGAMSAGRQRMVLLARATINDPDLLLLDEPCMNLDPQSRDLVLRAVEKLAAGPDAKTIIYVSHRADEVPRGFENRLEL